MKIEFEIPEGVVQAIAAAVVDRLRPAILGLKAPPAQSDDLMGLNQLAAYLGTSKDWIYQRTSKNEIPHVKIGRLLKFRKADVDRWLSTRSVPDIASVSAPLPPGGRGIDDPGTRRNRSGKRLLPGAMK